MLNSNQLLYSSFTIEGSSNVEIVGVHVGVARESQFQLAICWQNILLAKIIQTAMLCD